MSGGSHNYLYCKEFPEICDMTEDIEDIECRLMELGYNDIAEDCRRLIEYIQSARNRISVLSENLQDVFHAVEWYDSADIGKDSLIEHLEEYRTGTNE